MELCTQEKASTRDLFKMGAIVATGELWDMGLLGQEEAAIPEIRRFLAGFGINSFADLHTLGLGSAYLHDFEDLLASADCDEDPPE